MNGSAVQAFEHVCPERIDLIHKNYRRLCNLLVDIDEWGQVTVLSMLTRYTRSQFIDPNKVLNSFRIRTKQSLLIFRLMKMKREVFMMMITPMKQEKQAMMTTMD